MKLTRQYHRATILPKVGGPWQDRCAVMSIINATPDSFSADGLHTQNDILSVSEIKPLLWQALDYGADILDVGAESTRPGSVNIPPELQIRRLQPVFLALEEIAQERPGGWCVSLDTSDGAVARWGLEKGVQIINDVCGGNDPSLLEAVAEYNAEIVLMHNSSQIDQVENHQDIGSSYSAQQQNDLVENIYQSLDSLAVRAQKAGIDKSQIILDPGIGFGKTVADNLRLLSGTARLKNLSYPILVGASRKSFIGKITNLAVDQRQEASVAVHSIALFLGASIIRVHDVKAHHRARQMIEGLLYPESYQDV